MARKGWGALSPAYKKRLEKAGIDQAQYDAGASLSAARGHSKTPEHPRGNISRAKYPQYVAKRSALIRQVEAKKERLWGNSRRWDRVKSDYWLRHKAPSNKELEWALEASDEDLWNAIREAPEVYKWLGYH